MGLKLHLIINDEGEILSFCLISGNVDDRNEAVMDSLTKDIFGKLFADRGYIFQKFFNVKYSEAGSKYHFLLLFHKSRQYISSIKSIE